MEPAPGREDSWMQARVQQARVGRLATVTAEGAPHVVPFCFALVDRVIVTAVDAKPKSTSELRRLANIEANPVASVLVDHYADDWSELWWVRIDGVARVVRTGAERDDAIDRLVAKYPQYQIHRPEGAVIVIEATAWHGWAHDQPAT